MLLSQFSQHDLERPCFASAGSHDISAFSMIPVLISEGHVSLHAKLGREESALAWPTGKQRLRGAGKSDALAGGTTWASMKGRDSNPDTLQQTQGIARQVPVKGSQEMASFSIAWFQKLQGA